MEEKESPYFFLSLDLPRQAVFKDKQNKSLIQTVSLATLLQKFDGENFYPLGNGN